MPSLFCFFVDFLNMCCSAKIGYCNSNVDLNRARNWGGQEVSGQDLQVHIYKKKTSKGFLDGVEDVCFSKGSK